MTTQRHNMKITLKHLKLCHLALVTTCIYVISLQSIRQRKEEHVHCNIQTYTYKVLQELLRWLCYPHCSRLYMCRFQCCRN